MAVWLAYGGACTACKPGQCNDLPSKDEPWEPPTCDGSSVCVAECPNRFCGDNARRVVKYVTLAKHGNLPATGAILDQTQHFLNAMDFVLAQERLVKQKLKIWDTNG